MTHIDPSTLPIEHPLRNWPLADIGVALCSTTVGDDDGTAIDV